MARTSRSNATPLDGERRSPASGGEIERNPVKPLPEPLSGKPFFSCILAASSVLGTFKLEVPHRFCTFLPAAAAPVALISGDKTWAMTCSGDKRRFFDCRWRSFVIDNELRVGDACVFELLSGADESLVFKVQILEGHGCIGGSSGEPITID